MIELKSGLEPASRQLLEFLNSAYSKEIEDMTVEEARQALSMLQRIGPLTMPDADVEDRAIPGGANGTIGLRIVRPKGNAQRLPVVLYFHGGGWVLGCKEDFERVVREIASAVPAAVVFVDYGRAPEAKFPAGLEDCYAATKYIAENGAALNLDSSRLAIAGDSAGGNFAAVVSRLAKERGGPAISLQVLFNPATDASSETPSMHEFAEGYFLTLKSTTWFGGHYLSDPQERFDPRVSPLLAAAEQLQGLPPAVVITSEFDILRDQGEQYAHKLLEAGIPVAAVRYLGTIHGFTILNALANTASARSAMALAYEHLRTAFAEPGKQMRKSA
jgi:acetyl esterase